MAKSSTIVVVVAMAMVTLDICSRIAAESGTATFYTQYTPTACYGNQDHGVMIAAASDAFWNGGSACGMKYSVRCTGATNAYPHPCREGSVVVTIVDHCPGCQGTIDLSQQAFEIIADPVAGKVDVEFIEV